MRATLISNSREERHVRKRRGWFLDDRQTEPSLKRCAAEFHGSRSHTSNKSKLTSDKDRILSRMMSLPAATMQVDKSIQGKTPSTLKNTTLCAGDPKDLKSPIHQQSQAISHDMDIDIDNGEPSKMIIIQSKESTNIKQKHVEPIIEKSENTEIKTFKVKNTCVESTGPKLENATTQTECMIKYKMIPIGKVSDADAPSKVAVPRRNPPLSAPLLSERPLVLATHLVPSLPIALFEVLVEAIEIATGKPVVLIYESRNDRPVAKGLTDIAILPASEDWEEGALLPVSFSFEHHFNKEDSPCVYADVVVASDCAPHVEDITDLRGYRCSLPDRRKQLGAAALLFDHLYTRGESPAFFGNTLDTNTQIAALQMVAGKQAEVGVLESPVIKSHKKTLPGVESLCVLTSLGPLPPYRFMVNKSLPDVLVRKITAYLLNINQDKEWIGRFAPFGIQSFARNSMEFYQLDDFKSVVTSVPYY